MCTSTGALSIVNVTPVDPRLPAMSLIEAATETGPSANGVNGVQRPPPAVSSQLTPSGAPLAVSASVERSTPPASL